MLTLKRNTEANIMEIIENMNDEEWSKLFNDYLAFMDSTEWEEAGRIITLVEWAENKNYFGLLPF